MEVYALIISVLAVLIFAVIFVLIRGALKKKRRLSQFIREFGGKPDVRYDEDDFLNIPQYCLYRLQNTGEFKIDEVTWNDLNMDGLFVDINATQTNCGEQVLYDTLRTPVFDKEALTRRTSLTELLLNNESLRVKLQLIFYGLSRRRSANICEPFSEKKHGLAAVAVYIILAVAFLVFFVLTMIAPLVGAPYLFLSFVTNIIVYYVKRKTIEDELLKLNYALGIITAAKKIEKLGAPEISDYIKPLVEANKKLKSLSGLGTVTATATGNELNDIFGALFLWDLIRYNIARTRIDACFDELITLFEVIGGLDCAISAASYKKSLSTVCSPTIDFSSSTAYAEAEGLVHPMVEKAVPNDFIAHKSVLLTGSNASGKSTYLKTVSINAILAQTLGFCCARSYKASALRVYSSMALKDDLSSGESYYIVEIRSIKRIIDAAKNKPPVLCIVDEVLRGTNTIERIAASSEILRYIANSGALCVAATHDIELSQMLGGEYDNRHFEEYIENGKMLFSYELKNGPSKSRNAIRLLEIMGYDESIWQSAKELADGFQKSGKWGNV